MNKPGKQQVFSINTDEQFNEAALQVFNYQAKHNPVYRQFIEGLKIDPSAITSYEQIPFLPIEFFKSHTILSSDEPVEVTFTSSGTTGMITSSHRVTDKTWYEDSFRKAFAIFYGDIRDYTVLALLPSYLER